NHAPSPTSPSTSSSCSSTTGAIPRTGPAASAAASMRSLDVHTHVLPPELPLWSPIRLERVSECRARMLREDGSVFREIASNCWDATQRLQECDEARRGRQVASAGLALVR